MNAIQEIGNALNSLSLSILSKFQPTYNFYLRDYKYWQGYI